MEKFTSIYFLSKCAISYHSSGILAEKESETSFWRGIKTQFTFQDVITDTSGHQLINIISLNWIITQITAIMETYYAWYNYISARLQLITVPCLTTDTHYLHVTVTGGLNASYFV